MIEAEKKFDTQFGGGGNIQPPPNDVKGRIHSVQSLGAVDGPGVRYVVFTQGCPLRCVYCHNPDTWEVNTGQIVTADEIVKKVLRYRPYFGREGGVTVSGGEPLLQWEFVLDLFKKLKAVGINTALDTSGISSLEAARKVLQYTDIALVDLKFCNEEEYQKYCKGSYNTVIRFLDLTQEMNVPIWIRHVVVPGINDNKEDIGKIRAIAERYKNVKKIEWLPFHNMCIEKYEQMGIDFPLKDTPALSKETLNKLLD